MQIIGLAGKARSGKNTVADYLTTTYGFEQVALAGPIKAMLWAGLGLPECEFQATEQKEEIIPWYGVSYRRLAQTLGTEWGRAQNPDLWLIIARREIEGLRDQGCPGVAITDVRFDNEAEMIRRIGGQVWHIRRDAASKALPEATQAHASEQGVRLAGEDAILLNDADLQYLYRTVDRNLARFSFGAGA
jgi:hypothetical protein